MLLTALAQGNSVISENIFENRFMFASELNRMGSDITVEGHHALIQGVEKLQGAPVSSPDLRGGAALVIAGLAAEGETVVHDIYRSWLRRLCWKTQCPWCSGRTHYALVLRAFEFELG